MKQGEQRSQAENDFFLGGGGLGTKSEGVAPDPRAVGGHLGVDAGPGTAAARPVRRDAVERGAGRVEQRPARVAVARTGVSACAQTDKITTPSISSSSTASHWTNLGPFFDLVPWLRDQHFPWQTLPGWLG